MGMTCLGKPRSHQQLMTKQTAIEKRYQSYQSTKVSDEKIAAQSQGNRLKISKNLFICGICMQNYNTSDREPIIACHNQHTYCKQCLAAIQASNNKCAQCRQNLLAPARNRYIFQLVEDNIKSLQQGNIQPVDNKTAQVIRLSINTQTHLIQNFWIEGNRIMKIEDDRIWEGFVSKQTIMRDRECIFFVKIIHSKFNNVQIGVVGKGYKIEKNVTCPQSVVYHLADGSVLEGIEGRGCQWRKKGDKIAPGNQVQIEVRVSIPTKTITWLSDGKELASARLSDFILSHQCVAYFLMSHKEDIIELNG